MDRNDRIVEVSTPGHTPLRVAAKFDGHLTIALRRSAHVRFHLVLPKEVKTPAWRRLWTGTRLSDPATADLAKTGIFVGSLLAGLLGYLILRTVPASRGEA